MSASSLQTKVLRQATAPDEYRVYRAGLEWDLTDPIVIEKREDLKSEYRWRNRFDPFHHQVTNLITFCRRLPVTLLADDVGLGKTISAGLIISELIARSRLSKILIVCPKLLGPQWQEELQTKFDIPSEIAIGQRLISTEPADIGAVITTYASARLHLEKIPDDRFQMLVLDEAHKLRNLYGVEKPPQVAQHFRKALEERRFRYVLMLTATPIHNRLWDLYSLVDLLTVARGHENPFGSEGMFARRFIADSRDEARRLRPEAKDEFRSIVYGYMSRVRRGDAKLYFPDRIVQMHKVEPTTAELDLIKAIAKPIQTLNRLAQISILQALTSSPEALLAQLTNMGRNGTVPAKLVADVRAVVEGMGASAKLNGLAVLIDGLRKEDPQRWRLVIFTGRIETQTSIQAYLEGRGLKVGIINGSTGPRNQDTLNRFRCSPPDLHVIVSTEAGSEGINLQVANVLVNYDLPWNPMIVEQRIGRVQRLASEHKNVSIFNIMLKGTFEEYIVGRLMEKLQLASHAIGDIEALLQATDTNDDNDGVSFDERIRQLVVAALAGKDIEEATRREAASIDEAKRALESEEAFINSMLGSMDGAEYVGPRAPSLPGVVRSMDYRDFVLSAFTVLGARVTPQEAGPYIVDQDGGREYIKFEESEFSGTRSTLYAPGTPHFARLVDRVVATGIHDVADADKNPIQESEELVRNWVLSFGVSPRAVKIASVTRCFEGNALVRVRATVAHDSYERLVKIPCLPGDHHAETDRSGASPIPRVLENPSALGINAERLSEAARLDEGIAEFCRFYLERREQEVAAARQDERKKKKLEDEFTPRLEMALVALDGQVHREVNALVRYTIDGQFDYQSSLTVKPLSSALLRTPQVDRCARTGKIVPEDCLGYCEMSGAKVLKHILARSELTARLALPEYTVVCDLTGKRVLKDEAEISAVSGRLVASSLLKTSAISGKRAEPEHFDRCEFTNVEALKSELAVSDISSKRYRIDDQMRSAHSGKAGHKQEFVVCHETKEPIAFVEAEQCDLTGNYVRPGVLEQCEVTGKRVLPEQLSRCAITGKWAIKNLLVQSSVTGAQMLEELGTRSASGRYCTPHEAEPCSWSTRKFHPDDLRVCELTGLPIHFQFATTDHPRLRPLADLLNGIKRNADEPQLWESISARASEILRKKGCRVRAAILSPSGSRLAVCIEVRTLLGLRVNHAGLIYAIDEAAVIGHVVQVPRTAETRLVHG